MKAADAKKIRAYKHDGAWAIHLGDAQAFLDAAKSVALANQPAKAPVSVDQTGLAEAVKSLEVAVAFWGELIVSRLEEIESNTSPK